MTTILIVEDERVMSDVQKEAFERAGISCDVAGNGLEALKLLKKKDYGAVVMDIVMPCMDGFQLLKTLARNPKWEKLPLFVLSNLSQASDREQCERLGSCKYLLKTQTSLEALVNEVKKRLYK